MVENTHTFVNDERFDGQLPDEEIHVIQVKSHTIVWDYIVDGDRIGRREQPISECRTFVQSGVWKPRPM